MKIYFKHPSGLEFHFQRSPMAQEKFYALIALAGGALVVALLIGGVAVRYLR